MYVKNKCKIDNHDIKTKLKRGVRLETDSSIEKTLSQRGFEPVYGVPTSNLPLLIFEGRDKCINKQFNRHNMFHAQ